MEDSYANLPIPVLSQRVQGARCRCPRADRGRHFDRRRYGGSPHRHQRCGQRRAVLHREPQRLFQGAGHHRQTGAVRFRAENDRAARGIQIMIVADKGSTPPGYNYMPLLVRKALVDSGKVKSYKDLKGLKVAEAGQGGSPGSTLNEALKLGGLTYKDVEHVYMGYPQHVPALANGAVDASITTEPSTTQAVESGAAVRFSDDKVYPNQQVAVLLYGGDFIKRQPEVARKFMIAYIKAARFYNDALKDGRFAGPNAAEVISILAEDSNVKDKALYQKMVPNGRVNEASLTKDLQFYKDQGYLEHPIGLERVLDNSFVEHALKVLGPYKPKR